MDGFHGLVAQKMNFRTNFADADYIAFTDQILSGGGEYPHTAAGDQVEGRQGLPGFVNGFLLG